MILADKLYYNMTILSFIFFMLAGIFLCFNRSDSAFIKAVKYIILAISIDFVSVWYANSIETWSVTTSLNTLVLGDVAFKLGVSALLCMAATKMMMGNVSCELYVAILTMIGFIFSYYFINIEPNGQIVNILKSLLSAIGFSYLAAAYFTQCFRKQKSGAILGCLTATFIAYSTSSEMWVENMSSLRPWFIGALGCFGFGVSFLLSYINIQSNNIQMIEQKLDKYNQRIRDIIKSSPFPIIIAKLSDDSILLANDNFLKLFNLKRAEIANYKFKDFFVDEDNRRLLNVHLEKDKILKDFEILVQTPKDLTPFWLSTSANIIDYDYDIAIYAAFQEITDRKKREALLQTQATRDPLTSLYNRRYFEEEVINRIAADSDQQFSILMIDADHFKNVNDTYGHKIGDKVLMALASTTEKALRENDIVARYGGEEFVVYLAQSHETEALSVANRLRESIASVEVLSDAEDVIKFTVSIGVASSKETRDLGQLIKMSDDALYVAKEKGRNRCEIYSQHMSVLAREHNEQDNIHPAFSKTNDVEISLLGGMNSFPEDK